MATKRNNKYRIHLEEIELKDGTPGEQTITFEFENHDNIFSILEMEGIQSKFASEADFSEFVIGLKLFSEVMIKDRDNPLFEEFVPAFRQFMIRLKS